MNQHQFEIIAKLAPLSTLYGELKEGQAKIYAERLDAFSIAIIGIAVDRVIDTWKMRSYPPVGVLMDECRAQSGQKTNLHSAEKYPWIQRGLRIDRRVENFMNDFGNQPMARDAAREGWLPSLMGYVRCCAQLQAQIIEGDQNLRMPSLLLNWDEFCGLEILQERKRALMTFCCAQAATGIIAVEVPAEAVTCWRAETSRPIPTTPYGMRSAAPDLPRHDRAWFEARRPKPAPEPENRMEDVA